LQKKQKLSPAEMELSRKKFFISVGVPLSWAMNAFWLRLVRVVKGLDEFFIDLTEGASISLNARLPTGVA
jgi:hypothetical protein